MSTSFLPLVHKRYPSGYAGDEYGGGAGTDGSGLPTGSPGNFMFATGIECSNPTIHHGALRRDLLAECGHYDRYAEDLGLVKEMGLRYLRYGLPYHLTSPRQGRYDWAFADAAMAEIRRLGITPILDLLHFGVPDWLGDFQNPELPLHFANYAGAVAKRYPWVRFYTPVNEIYVTARASALDGVWNEQLRTDRAFVTALKHTVAASILATQRIAAQRPDCVIVQSESAEYLHEAVAAPSEATRLHNAKRFLSLDLLYGHPPDAEMLLYLLDNGLSRDEYAWFMAGEPPGYQVLGSDYYGRNERIKLADGSTCEAQDVLGWYRIVSEYVHRYRKPVMHTETNVFDPAEAPAWLWKQWMNALQLRKDGVPVLGFTWYSLIDQVDWNIQLSRKEGTVNGCGLYDMDRNIRPVGRAYQMLLEEFGQITVVPHGELFDVTGREARLKVTV